jgi:2,5-dioxopentanoate dehydrogenase
VNEIVDRALRGAAGSFAAYAAGPPARRAELLRRVAAEIDALGDRYIEQVAAETALSRDRLLSERSRATAQLQMFAALVEEGSWVDARIDTARPERRPAPKPDIRRLLVPIGPVVVFGASNFPIAFSVAGGDTASALAAGCPVVVRPHPAHPETGAEAAGAVHRAVDAVGMPAGTFSVVGHGGHDVGLDLVRHPQTRAVAFTGSLRGGRALWDAAAARLEPIPVYAEMGSLNPVFVLPSALDAGAERLAESFAASMLLGVGQFCTKPGLLVAARGPGLDRFVARLADVLAAAAPARMLSPELAAGYEASVGRARTRPNVSTLASPPGVPGRDRLHGTPVVLCASASTFTADESLRHEMFGPASLVVVAEDGRELVDVARHLQGQLTATVHGSERELAEYATLIDHLRERAGRLVFNGFPTGLEVCPSTHHGGPYPATTDIRSTSVGTAAILRFVRPVCYQNWPDAELPIELRDANERGLWRMVDGRMTTEPVRRDAPPSRQ